MDMNIKPQKNNEEPLQINQSIKNKLDYFYVNNTIPHILFHGSSGTGKKTLVFEFLYKIYENDKTKIKKNVMFVNCSHGKGIKFIREELKFFAKANLQSNSGVKFKSIVLFNADSLTNDAQSALRRCIELFSYNTRFFIVVENKQRLLNPILSRFCEIYVPEYIQNKKIINLHQYNLNKKCDISELYDNKQKWMNNYMEKLDSTNYVNLTNASIDIYEQGYSCLDLMEYIQSKCDIKWTGEECSKFFICFHTIKSEFRCEKLLILYILDLIFFRKNDDMSEILII